MLFQLPYAEISGTTLVLYIYDFDRFSKHDQIGQLKIPLGSIDLCQTLEEWRPIEPTDSENEKVSPQYFYFDRIEPQNDLKFPHRQHFPGI